MQTTFLTFLSKPGPLVLGYNMAQPNSNQFYPENGTPLIMGNNGFNECMQKPFNVTVKETACVNHAELDTTTGNYTSKGNIQYGETNTLAGKETNRESVQHIKPDEYQSNWINTSTNELSLRGHTINNTCEQTSINACINRTQNRVQTQNA